MWYDMHAWWMWVWPIVIVGIIAWTVWMVSRSAKGGSDGGRDRVPVTVSTAPGL